jgi:hypothetical protein
MAANKADIAPGSLAMLAWCAAPREQTALSHLAAANSNAEFGQKHFSFGGVPVIYDIPVRRLDVAIRNQVIESLAFVVNQLPTPLRAAPTH